MWVQGLRRTGCASGPAARVDGPSGTYPTPFGDSTVVWGRMVVWHSADVYTFCAMLLTPLSHCPQTLFVVSCICVYSKHCVSCLSTVFMLKQLGVVGGSCS